MTDKPQPDTQPAKGYRTFTDSRNPCPTCGSWISDDAAAEQPTPTQPAEARDAACKELEAELKKAKPVSREYHDAMMTLKALKPAEALHTDEMIWGAYIALLGPGMSHCLANPTREHVWQATPTGYNGVPLLQERCSYCGTMRFTDSGEALSRKLWSCIMCRRRVEMSGEFHVNDRPLCVECNAEMEPWRSEMPTLVAAALASHAGGKQ